MEVVHVGSVKPSHAWSVTSAVVAFTCTLAEPLSTKVPLVAAILSGVLVPPSTWMRLVAVPLARILVGVAVTVSDPPAGALLLDELQAASPASPARRRAEDRRRVHVGIVHT